jgi:protein-S-isoprenylcysteine O-methyltransferase Ste14
MTTTDQPTEISRNLWEIVTNVVLGVLFTFFAYAAFLSWQATGDIQALLLMVQESIIVVLLITRRRSREASTSWYDRLIAIAGTAAPLLQRPAPTTILELTMVGTSLQLVSLLLTLVATLSLGRSFGIVAANRGVQTGGLYRFVRHPLYGSYLIAYIGFLIGNPSILNVVLIIITFVCQYLRAVAEERVLARDPDYVTYMSRVRARFIPFLF